MEGFEPCWPSSKGGIVIKSCTHLSCGTFCCVNYQICLVPVWIHLNIECFKQNHIESAIVGGFLPKHRPFFSKKSCDLAFFILFLSRLRGKALQLRTAWLESFEGLPPLENQPWINEYHYTSSIKSILFYIEHMDIQEPFLNGFSFPTIYIAFLFQWDPDDFKMCSSASQASGGCCWDPLAADPCRGHRIAALTRQGRPHCPKWPAVIVWNSMVVYGGT